MCLMRLSRLMASIRDKFILNSDYPIDKIVWLKEGEKKMNASGSTGDNPIEITHNMGVQVYVTGVWTIDDWQTTYTFNADRVDGQGYLYQSVLGSTDAKVYVFAAHASGANKQFKYRIWGFMHEDATKGIEAKATAGYGMNRLVFSTDYEYPMLYKEGTASPNTVITHSLGVIPYVDIWGKSSYGDHRYSLVTDDQFGQTYGTGELIKITDSTITISSDTSQYNGYYYRIYLP